MTTEPNGEAIEPVEDSPLAETEGAEAEVETTEGDEPEVVDEAPKPKKTAKERIDELTAARRTAERDAEYWREQAMRAAPQPTPPAAQPNDGRPDPSSYPEGAYDPAYIEDLTDWKAEQAVSRTMSVRERQTTLAGQVRGFEQRVSEMFPDGEPEGLTALRRAPALPEAVQEILLTSENGPKLADYLGSNPREFARLSALTPPQQAYELAKIERKLETAPLRTNTNAPPPAPTARGNGGRFQVAPDTADFAAFEKQYRA